MEYTTISSDFIFRLSSSIVFSFSSLFLEENSFSLFSSLTLPSPQVHGFQHTISYFVNYMLLLYNTF